MRRRPETPNEARRRTRERAGMSRQELADRVNAQLRRDNLTSAHVGRWEDGAYRWPHKAYREALRAALGARTDSELGFAPRPRPAPTRVAITGHRDLTPHTMALVEDQLRALLASLSPNLPSLLGRTCLAPGADQTFARTVLDLGGGLHVVVPHHGFRDIMTPDERGKYDDFLTQAKRIHQLGFPEPSPSAHQAANALLLSKADHLIAVWDGQPGRGPGGTADAVTHARERHLPTTVLWPPGASRRPAA